MRNRHMHSPAPRARAAPRRLQWKAVGDAGWEARVDANIELAQHVEERVKASGGRFVLTLPRPACPNVCFWYVPTRLRPFAGPDGASEAALAALGRVAPGIKARMQAAGDAMIGFQPLGRLPNFFRIVLSNVVGVSKEQLDGVLARIEAHGEALDAAEAA